METIKLDLIPGKKMPSLNASQYDKGRDYHIDLTENRVPYTLDGTETISLTVRKCDNTLVTMDIANTFADKSYIEFRTTEQMNACAGFNYGEITIEKNGTQISSLNFYLQVEGAPDEGGITSQSEINNLARQVHDIAVEELADHGAEDTGYNNTESGLEATNVQNAIDEVNTKIENIPSVDAYTKEQSDQKFATKTALQTVANAVEGKANESEVTALKSGLYKKYDGYVEGGINSTGGFSTSLNWVRTDFISVDEFFHVYKPLDVSDRIAFYEKKDTSTFIAKEDYSQNVDLDSDLATQIKTTYPTAKYIAMGLRKYSGGSQVAFVPADVDGTGFVLTTFPTGLAKPTSDIVYTMVNQYFTLENKTITSNMTMTVLLGDERFKNMLVKSDAMYSGTNAPTIQFGRNWKNYQGVSGQKYTSPFYEIGGKGNYKYQEWRVPQWLVGCDDDKYCSVMLTIPSGTTLYLKSLSNEYSDMVSREGCGINLNAHGTSGCGAPINTLYAFTMAAKLGYKYCITIPKVTSDGVYVCLHDDASIQATARNDDGTEIAAQYRDRPVSDFTYAELLQFDFGIKTGIPFKGARIPLLEDYFKICSVSGMHPMLSVHPDLAGHWNNIKAMAKKYGVLEKLNIKGSPTNLPAPMSVLGDEIESYTLNRSVGESVIATFNTLLSTYNITKAKKVIEYAENVLTDALIEEVLSNGFVLGAYNIYDVSLSYARVKELIEKGATEFTENFNCCVGLSWL